MSGMRQGCRTHKGHPALLRSGNPAKILFFQKIWIKAEFEFCDYLRQPAMEQLLPGWIQQQVAWSSCAYPFRNGLADIYNHHPGFYLSFTSLEWLCGHQAWPFFKNHFVFERFDLFAYAYVHEHLVPPLFSNLGLIINELKDFLHWFKFETHHINFYSFWNRKKVWAHWLG